jgi:hypothetical protein
VLPFHHRFKGLSDNDWYGPGLITFRTCLARHVKVPGRNGPVIHPSHPLLPPHLFLGVVLAARSSK